MVACRSNTREGSVPPPGQQRRMGALRAHSPLGQPLWRCRSVPRTTSWPGSSCRAGSTLSRSGRQSSRKIAAPRCRPLRAPPGPLMRRRSWAWRTTPVMGRTTCWQRRRCVGRQRLFSLGSAHWALLTPTAAPGDRKHDRGECAAGGAVVQDQPDPDSSASLWRCEKCFPHS